MNHIQYLEKQIDEKDKKDRQNKKIKSEIIRLCEFIQNGQNMDANVMATQILEREATS